MLWCKQKNVCIKIEVVDGTYTHGKSARDWTKVHLIRLAVCSVAIIYFVGRMCVFFFSSQILHEIVQQKNPHLVNINIF